MHQIKYGHLSVSGSLSLETKGKKLNGKLVSLGFSFRVHLAARCTLYVCRNGRSSFFFYSILLGKKATFISSSLPCHFPFQLLMVSLFVFFYFLSRRSFSIPIYYVRFCLSHSYLYLRDLDLESNKIYELYGTDIVTNSDCLHLSVTEIR